MSRDGQTCSPNPDPHAADEFARGSSVWPNDPDGSSRRSFLKRMAAALALAGVAGPGCSDRPDSKIVPYVSAPDGVVPGEPMTFATTMGFSGHGIGVLAISREGRPIKIEGNPNHPSSLGGTNVFVQASILDLYDPTRLQSPTYAGSPTSWDRFDAALQARLEIHRHNGGQGLRILSGTITSPTLVAQMAALEQQFPQARWHQFEPLAPEQTFAATAAAFGRPLQPVYDFKRAKVIVSLDSDFLFELPGSIRYARDFIDGRRVRDGQTEMNRLYVAESTWSLAGSMADHRLPAQPSQIEAIARALAAAVGVSGLISNDAPDQRWIRAVADDLLAHRGASLVIAGECQPAAVHQLAYAINTTLGNVGQTARFIEPLSPNAGDAARTLAALTNDMRAGDVQTLLILAEDPAYAAPADIPFAEALQALSTARGADGIPTNFTAYLGQRPNDTGFRCQWQLPQTHYLEEWGDLRGHDGTTSLVQPLILPFFGGRSTIELLDRMLRPEVRSGYQIVREHWQQALGNSFDAQWQTSLQRGVIGNAAPAVDVQTPPMAAASAPIAAGAFEVEFRPDPSAWDGRFTENAWLQELPRPFTKLVWDNAALLSQETADVLGVEQMDLVKITVDGRSIEIPAAIVPGLPKQAITLHLGYGRTTDGGTPIGVNIYPLRTSTARGFTTATVEKVGRQHKLVATRNHFAMAEVGRQEIRNDVLRPDAVITSDMPEEEREASNNRRLVRIATIDAFRSNHKIIKDLGGEGEKRPLLSLFPDWDYSKGYQWGMSIDHTACIGCNACIVACQAENNIPVVGKDQVDRRREMHWLRVDDYFSGNEANPQVTHQPVPCMHCETAPCEVVCPVAATTHSVEGLNQMTYNRCVGTRYCSNNCPYKVRRFNFLDYTSKLNGSTTQLQKNPEVTIRARGVMEKCSYCIQRLQRTRIKAERVVLDLKERARNAPDDAEKNRLLAEADRREFELVDSLDTACAQACPTRAITFGSILPVGGQATRLMREKRQPHDYTLLRELTTKPRTSYLGRITNPNPALAEGGGAA